MGLLCETMCGEKRIPKGVLSVLMVWWLSLLTVCSSQFQATHVTTYNVTGADYACKKCEPGHFFVRDCPKGESHKTLCSLCRTGTYNSGYSIATYCTQCTPDPCHWPQVVIRECTTKSDTLCGCDQRYYDDDGVCVPHSKCDKGFGVAKLGTQTSDTDCQPCPGGFYSNITSATERCQVRTNCGEKGLDIETLGDKQHDNICCPKSHPHCELVTKPTTKPTIKSTLPSTKTKTTKKASSADIHVDGNTSQDRKLAAIVGGTLGTLVLTLVAFLLCVLIKRAQQSSTIISEADGAKDNLALDGMNHENEGPNAFNGDIAAINVQPNMRLQQEMLASVGRVAFQEDDLQTACVPKPSNPADFYSQDEETTPKRTLVQNNDNLWRQVFQIISKKVGKPWKNFLRNLRDPLSESEIDYLSADYQTTEEMIIQALRKWKEKVCNGTFTDIINGLVATGKCDLADEVKQHLQAFG